MVSCLSPACKAAVDSLKTINYYEASLAGINLKPSIATGFPKLKSY
jgi:hypothetical protein